jgi:adenylate cyclase
MNPPRLNPGWLLPIISVLASVALYWADPPPLRTLRDAGFDQYQRWDARPYREAPVRIIDSDDVVPPGLDEAIIRIPAV